jgi:hypothetical protein
MALIGAVLPKRLYPLTTLNGSAFYETSQDEDYAFFTQFIWLRKPLTN